MPHDIDAERTLLQEATARLIRTVDGLADADFSGPSGLPDWTRGHVVAHLALNSEGLTGALTGIVQGEPTPMYASQEDRDGDIEKLAGASPTELRERLLGGSTEFDDAVAAVPGESWGGTFERTPGGQVITAANVPTMRLREVEIHHADLDAGYTAADWPLEFSRLLLDSMLKFRDQPGLVASPTDLDGTWTIGGGGPTVTGTAAALGWWLTGRGLGDGLTSSDGTIPEVGAW